MISSSYFQFLSSVPTAAQVIIKFKKKIIKKKTDALRTPFLFKRKGRGGKRPQTNKQKEACLLLGPSLLSPEAQCQTRRDAERGCPCPCRLPASQLGLPGALARLRLRLRLQLVGPRPGRSRGLRRGSPSRRRNRGVSAGGRGKRKSRAPPPRRALAGRGAGGTGGPGPTARPAPAPRPGGAAASGAVPRQSPALSPALCSTHSLIAVRSFPWCPDAN